MHGAFVIVMLKKLHELQKMHGMVGMILSVMTLARILIRSYEDHHHGREKPKLMEMFKHI